MMLANRGAQVSAVRPSARVRSEIGPRGRDCAGGAKVARSLVAMNPGLAPGAAAAVRRPA